MRRRETTYRRSLVLSDAVATLVTIWLAVSVLGEDQLRLGTLFFVPIVVVLAKVTDLYDRDELVLSKSTVEELPRLFQLATLTTLLFYFLEPLLINGLLGHGQAFALWVVLAATIAVGRFATRRVLARTVAVERCLVIGDPLVLERLQKKFAHERSVELVGSVPLEQLFGSPEALRRVTRELCAHRLIIAPKDGAVVTPQTVELVRDAKATGLRVSLLPGVLDIVGTSVVFDTLHGFTLLGVRRFGLTHSSRVSKRALDIAGSGLGLLVTAPLIVAIAVAIRLDSHGPVFYRQERVGRDGKRFTIWKFRSMVDDADAMRDGLADRNEASDGLFKIAGDPRITRVGARLRCHSLDELPQLFNVLRGEMSLVGPRPLVAHEDSLITGGDRRRLHLTPGMTGEWQIAGSARVPMAEMVKMDYLYVAGWSLWSDVKILIRTVRYVLDARGQ